MSTVSTYTFDDLYVILFITFKVNLPHDWYKLLFISLYLPRVLTLNLQRKLIKNFSTIKKNYSIMVIDGKVRLQQIYKLITFIAKSNKSCLAAIKSNWSIKPNYVAIEMHKIFMFCLDLFLQYSNSIITLLLLTAKAQRSYNTLHTQNYTRTIVID